MIFLDGKYQESSSGKTFENISPIDGKTINHVAFSQKEDVDRAVVIARKVFEKGSWSKTEPSHRKKVLLKLTKNENTNYWRSRVHWLSCCYS